MSNLIIPDSVYPYLRAQKGEINHIQDRQAFEAAYNKGLQELLAVILPYVPAGMKRSIDIGSGMGGIDILLHNLFKHDVFLLDALDTPPVCTKHDRPFNNKNVLLEFWHENEKNRIFYYSPEDASKPIKVKFDLILSVGSYCFHYSPELYLDFVKASCHEDTVLIFDVRNRHADWLEILRDNFKEVAVILESEKFTKRVFKSK